MKKRNYPNNIFESFLITIVFLVTILLVLFIFSFIPSFTNKTYLLTISKILAYSLGFYLTFKFVTRKSVFRRFDAFVPKLRVLLFTALISTTSILIFYFPFDYLFTSSFKQNFSGGSFTLDNIIGELLLSPITEELIFRAIILKGLLIKIKPWKAILISALLFGVPHFNPINQGAIINAILLGILTGWIYYKTKNVVYTIFMHFITNFTILSTIYYFNNQNPEVFLNENYTLYGKNSIVMTIIFLIIFFVSIYMTKKILYKDLKLTREYSNSINQNKINKL